jgi:uncharacterized membrane protein YqjE
MNHVANPAGARVHPRYGSLAGVLATASALLDSFLHLLTLEAKEAGIALAYIVGFGLAAAVLIITGWLALIACVVVALVANDLIGWPVALIVAAVLSFAGSGGLAFLIFQRSRSLLFTATRRQLGGGGPPATQHEQLG